VEGDSSDALEELGKKTSITPYIETDVTPPTDTLMLRNGVHNAYV
jgi:hypothetical protein